MRITAGILMIIVGSFLLITGVNASIESIGFGIYDSAFVSSLFIAIFAIFRITGGVFCLKRKYWKVCFASALLLFGFSVYFLSAFAILEPAPALYLPDLSLTLPPYGLILTAVLGIPPLIFICLRKREWEEPDFLRDEPSIPGI